MLKPAPNTKHTLLGNSAWIFLIRFFPALASLIMMIQLSKSMLLGQDFYGFYQSFWVQLQVFNVIACLGIPALLITFPIARIHEFFSKKSKIKGWLIALWVVVVAGAFMFLFPGGWSFFYYKFAFSFLVITALSTIGEAYLISGKSFKLLAIVSLLHAAAFIVFHCLLIRDSISARWLFYSLLIAAALKLFAILPAVIRVYKSSNFSSDDESSSASFRSLWFHLGLYDLVQVLFRWGDKFVLSFLLSKELFAVYFNGTIEIPFLALLLGAVGSALLLQMNKADTSEIARIRLLKESSSQLSLIVFPLFLFFLLFRNELFEVVFTHRYSGAVPLFLINCFIIPLRCYNFTSILQNKGKGRIINIGAVLDLIIALVLVYPLFLLWGLSGVTLAFVISTYVQAVFYLWQTAKVMDCKITDLLPINQWLRNAIIFSILFIALYYTGSSIFSPFNTLLLGGGATLVIIFFNLMNVFLRKRI